MRRKTKKLPCPNPFFERLLSEWRDEARQNGWKLQHAYAKALSSIQKYPLPLQSGQEAMILEGIGESIAKKLDQALSQQPNYQEPVDEIRETDVVEVRDHVGSVQSRSSDNAASTASTSGNGSKRKKTMQPAAPKEYIPGYRTGTYALLVTLYKHKQRENSKGFMTKDELQKEAQPLSIKSFTLPDPGTRYTAWSSMSTLTKKGFVIKHSNPAKYSITPEGCNMAQRILDAGAQASCNSLSAINFTIGAGSSSSTVSSSSVDDSRSSGILQEPLYPSLHVALKQTATEQSSSGYTRITEKPKQSVLSVDVEENQSTVTSGSTGAKTISLEFVLKQGTFDVILCVDFIETTGGAQKSRKDSLVQELNNNGVQYDVRKLQVGDFAWVARDKTRPDRELVLDYIVERKRMDDLNQSIIDGRFREQKFRLKNSGLKHPIYLVENFGSSQHLSLPEATLQQAIVNTQVVDGFFVKRTKDIKESCAYLTLMTRFLQSLYMGETLRACPRDQLEHLSSAPPSCDVMSRDVNLMTFQEFNKEATKNKVMSVREMFGKHLMQLSGMSADKAMVILEHYPTPRRLMEAYDKQPTIEQKERMLASLKYGNAKKSFGPALSKLVYQLYCTKDWPS